MNTSSIITQPETLKAIVGYYLRNNTLSAIQQTIPVEYSDLKGMPGIMDLFGEYRESCDHRYFDAGSFFEVFFSIEHLYEDLQESDPWKSLEARCEADMLRAAAEFVGQEIDRFFPVR